MRKQYVIGITIAVLVTGTMCRASSIWARRSSTSKPMYADDKANQIGDLLTIIISEDHRVDNKVKRDLAQSTNRQLGIGSKDISVEHVLPSVPEVNIDLQSQRSLQGQSDYKDERSIEDSITVVVVDIHPNGNLVVLGTRSRDINTDLQEIQVSGVVRPSDIQFGNLVHSERVAQFRLVALSEGVSDHYNNPGWLARFLDKIWPF